MMSLNYVKFEVVECLKECSSDILRILQEDIDCASEIPEHVDFDFSTRYQLWQMLDTILNELGDLIVYIDTAVE